MKWRETHASEECEWKGEEGRRGSELIDQIGKESSKTKGL